MLSRDALDEAVVHANRTRLRGHRPVHVHLLVEPVRPKVQEDDALGLAISAASQQAFDQPMRREQQFNSVVPPLRMRVSCMWCGGVTQPTRCDTKADPTRRDRANLDGVCKLCAIPLQSDAGREAHGARILPRPSFCLRWCVIMIVKKSSAGKNWAMPPRILLIDNSKPECAIFTPKLLTLLQNYGVVTACNTRTETIAALATPHYDAIVFSGSSLNMSESLVTAAISKDLMMLLRHLDACRASASASACSSSPSRTAAKSSVCRRRESASSRRRHRVRRGRVSRDDLAYFSHQGVVVAVPPDFAIDGTSDGYVFGDTHSTSLSASACSFTRNVPKGRSLPSCPSSCGGRCRRACRSHRPCGSVRRCFARWRLDRAETGAEGGVEYAIERDDERRYGGAFATCFASPPSCCRSCVPPAATGRQKKWG